MINSFSYHSLLNSMVPEITKSLRQFNYDVDVHFVFVKPFDVSSLSKVYLYNIIRQCLRFGDSIYHLAPYHWAVVTHRTNANLEILVPHRLKQHLLSMRPQHFSANISSLRLNKDAIDKDIFGRLLHTYDDGLIKLHQKLNVPQSSANGLFSCAFSPYINIESGEIEFYKIDLIDINKSLDDKKIYASNYSNFSYINIFQVNIFSEINYNKIIIDGSFLNNDNFDKFIAKILTFYNPKKVIFDLNSNIFMSDKLKKFGFKICLNSAEISQFISDITPDYLRISGDFIRSIPYIWKNEIILNSLIYFSENLNIDIIVDGVLSKSESIFLYHKKIKIQNILF